MAAGAETRENPRTMATIPLLPPDRAGYYRRMLLLATLLTGVAAGVIVLSSQEVADFLREGPVRVTSLHDDTLRIVLGLGAIASAVLAVLAVWPRAGLAPIAVGLVALGVGVFLLHAMFMPAAVLFAGSVAVHAAGQVPRDRFHQLGPRRYPIPWLLAAGGTIAGLVGLVWLSVWLIQPLFDEGETLNETLAFNVEGVEQPAVNPPDTAAASDDTASDDEATPDNPAAQSAVAAAEPSGEGTLISQGVLMGTDAFHTGSGDVLLVVGPGGEAVLRFQDYAVRNGPDLHVYLTPDPDADVHADGAIDLGAVKATNGSVNYELPAGVDPAIFRTVVIYCVPFSVTFATASLSES